MNFVKFCQKNLCFWFSVFLVSLFFSQSVFAQSDPFQFLMNVGLIKGVKKISVSIGGLEPDLKAEGITEEKLEMDVELLLRRIGVYDKEKSDSYIYVDVTSINIDGNFYTYSINVSFNQNVTVLKGKSPTSAIITTWSKNTLIYIRQSKIQTIRDELGKLVNSFIDVYLTVNNEKINTSSKISPQDNTNKPKENSPFTATYVGGNRAPEVEIFNDTDRTLYFDFGQDKLTPYTIPPQTSKKITLTEGSYKYKATVPRIVPLSGQENFRKGYAYTWRFAIITQRIN